MDFGLKDFRNAKRLLAGQAPWISLATAIASIDRDLVIKEQETLAAAGHAPRGGQKAMNSLFERMLGEADGWTHQPRLFRSPELREWKMDFLRDRVGVEISFNHAEAIPWQFTRLNIAGESELVLPESRIDVGIVVTAMRSLKAWSRMDSAVGTFDGFAAWLDQMKPILPIPILLVGLDATGWSRSEAFQGTRTLTRS